TVVLPALSGLIMAALFVYIFLHFGDLTGTTGGALGLILPALIPAAAVVGYGLSLRLERADPARFARMGENQA
ncbi:MAG: amino acid permease, partial [Mesorhizobium sp.]